MIPLHQIQVPEPCGEDWGAMDGDARRRFCAGCGCHVHNLSGMTSAEVQGLLDRAEGRLCVRFETQPDGTVLTQDTAAVVSGRHALWPRRLAAAASWALALAVSAVGLTARAQAPHGTANTAHPKARVLRPATRRMRVTLGKIAVTHRPSHVTAGVVLPPPATMGAPLPVMGKPVPPPKK